MPLHPYGLPMPGQLRQSGVPDILPFLLRLRSEDLSSAPTKAMDGLHPWLDLAASDLAMAKISSVRMTKRSVISRSMIGSVRGGGAGGVAVGKCGQLPGRVIAVPRSMGVETPLCLPACSWSSCAAAALYRADCLSA